MNLLMLIIIFVALWIAGAIAYFAWTLTPEVPDAHEADDAQESEASPDSERSAEQPD